MTVRLQSRVKKSYHGTLWEGLPAIEFLSEKMISAKKDHTTRMEAEDPGEDNVFTQTNKYITTSFDNCWGKLNEYYKMLDETPVYVAAIVLHSGQGWRYLERKWTTNKQKNWLESAREVVKTLWENIYNINFDFN
jgi:uncharacterized protein YyaL (SSP411 family)